LSDINPAAIFIALVVLAFSLSFHEMAHAWTAYRLGDPTAYQEGRVSMNPAVHVDPIGTILFPLISMIATAAGGSLPLIGWAKPVPFLVRNLSRPRRDVILIALAGPASNVILAALISVVIRIALPMGWVPTDGIGNPTGPVWEFRLQPHPDSTARRRQGIVQPAAAALGAGVRRVRRPIRLHRSLRAHADRGALVLHAAVDELPRRTAAVVVTKRVVSGMRPTGKLHLGHLVGALRNWVELQDRFDCFYFVADWHALTSEYADTKEIVANGIDNAADWIAAGIDPEKSTLFVQSMVPEHAELHLLLSMIAPTPWLERVPTYKEQQEQVTDRDLATYGFLGYPLLQTADVVIYNAHAVPVGEDQVPHLELSREIVRRFNGLYGEVFVEPQPMLTRFARLPGVDNRKMSKSYRNAINLSDTPDEVKKKVMSMYTDPKRVRADTPGTVEGNPVFIYHDAFNPDTAEVDDLKARYRLGTVGDVEVKRKLIAALNAALEPLRERRATLARPERVREILHAGAARARAIAVETMGQVRDAMHLKY
jgi:tryptophanyl-tRNA synthetase